VGFLHDLVQIDSFKLVHISLVGKILLWMGDFRHKLASSSFLFLLHLIGNVDRKNGFADNIIEKLECELTCNFERHVYR
jgi:hypothetical protein